jgi:hypothetical protein
MTRADTKRRLGNALYETKARKTGQGEDGGYSLGGSKRYVPPPPVVSALNLQQVLDARVPAGRSLEEQREMEKAMQEAKIERDRAQILRDKELEVKVQKLKDALEALVIDETLGSQIPDLIKDLVRLQEEGATQCLPMTMTLTRIQFRAILEVAQGIGMNMFCEKECGDLIITELGGEDEYSYESSSEE